MSGRIRAAVFNCFFSCEAVLLDSYPVELGYFLEEIWQLPYILFLPNQLRCEKLAKTMVRTGDSLIGRMTNS